MSTVVTTQLVLVPGRGAPYPSLLEKSAPGENGCVQYRIIQGEVKDTSFYSFVVKDGVLVLVLNREHLFYRKLYKPLVENETRESKDVRSQVDLLLLAAARAEAAASRESQREMLTQFRKTRSDNLATFLNGRFRVNHCSSPRSRTRMSPCG